MPDEPSSGPAYRVVTARTVIRCWNPADAPLLKAAVDASREHLLPWMPWAANHPQPVGATVDLLRRFRGQFDLGQDFVYGIFDLEETRVLGGTGLHPRIGENALEIGYWIHVDHTDRGIATEVAAALTRVAFEVNRVRRVEIHCVPENVRSAAVPRKLGYVHEATLAKRMMDRDTLRDAMVWSLFSDGYASSPAAQAKVEAYDALGEPLLALRQPDAGTERSDPT